MDKDPNWVARIRGTTRRLQWKLTLSYSAVTVGALLVVVLIAGYVLFSFILVPLDILNSVLSPQAWIKIVSESAPPEWSYVLSQDPVDTQLISLMLQRGDLQVSYFDLFRIGDLQVRLRTAAQGSVLLVDPQGVLLGISNPELAPGAQVGHPLDPGILPGLESALGTALQGEVDPQRLFVTLQANESFYFVIPYLAEGNGDVLGAGVIYFERLPSENDLPANILTLLGRSALVLLLAAGLVGALFGAITARYMVMRFRRISRVTGAWSHGDFSEFIDDPGGDEISQLAGRLNQMAVQLQDHLAKSKEMAVSAERNRLARDLHDSAKQEALAASFHLGAALALFEREPQQARSHIVEAEGLVDGVRLELTDLIHELRPPTTDGVRFDEALNEYIIEWAHQTGIEATFQTEGSAEPPLATKHAVFRIVQEALANVARHSSAQMVEIALEFVPGWLRLSVQDDGVGFDPHLAHAGMGLDSMRERAEGLGGELHIQSEPGKGTRLRADVPLNGERRA